MTKTINSTNSVNTLVQGFKAILPESLEKQREFEVLGYRVVWKQIAEAYFVAQKIKAEPKKTLEAALTERSLKASTKAGANPYLPIVQLLYGKWNEEDATLFEPNRSAEKYACVMRYFNKRASKFQTLEDIVDHIEGTEGHLKAIEILDRKEHQRASAATSSAEELKRGLSVRGALEIGSLKDVREAVIDLPDDAQQGQVWFKVEGGKVYLMGFKALEDAARDNLAKKRGKVLLKAAQVAAKNAELAETE